MDAIRSLILKLAAERQQHLSHISKAIGRNSSYLQQFIRRGVPAVLPEKVRLDLASHFGIDESELGGPTRSNAQTRGVPIISWVSAGALKLHDSAPDSEVLGHIQTTGLGQGNWIALRVEGDSMDRISPPESIIFVNRDERRLIPNGLYVIATESGETTYKRYRPAPDRFEPVSVNSTHEAIFPRGQIRVIGRVRRTMLDT